MDFELLMQLYSILEKNKEHFWIHSLDTCESADISVHCSDLRIAIKCFINLYGNEALKEECKRLESE